MVVLISISTIEVTYKKIKISAIINNIISNTSCYPMWLMTNKSLSIREKTIFDGIFTKYVLKSIFKVWFKLAGWKVCKHPPEGAGVAIAAPHTSNWDFIYALGAAILQDVKIYFSIKDSLCKVPVLGSILMWLGAIPIDRSSKGEGQVEKIKAFIDSQKGQRVFFLFTPEGTRGAVSKWKTGFYHIAKGANVPIVMFAFDFGKKEISLSEPFYPTDDMKADFDYFLNFYKNVTSTIY